MEKRILKNSIKCEICKDIITSNHVHSYITCECGACSVDGGLSYLRRSYKNKDLVTDLSVYDDGKSSTRAKNLQWGSNYSKDGKLLDNTLYRSISELDDEHLYKILETQKLSKIYEDTISDEIIAREEQFLIDNPDIELKW